MDDDVSCEVRSNDNFESRSISPTFPAAERLLVEGCLYRGEGNANIVISLPHERKVIRFWKISPGENAENGKRHVEKEMKFVEDVAARFLGSYVQVPEIHRYDIDDIVKLSEAIRPLRPRKRRHKNIIDEYATKYPDYAYLREDGKIGESELLYRCESTFCVEIKPKQGYLREPEHQPFQKCPYRLMQYYKLEKGEISAHSDYCPFDLFSGDERRMQSAITGLLKCPQNNLKILKDGRVVYDDERSWPDLERILAECFSTGTTPEVRLRQFCTLISSALLKPFYADELACSDLESSKNDSSEQQSLPRNSVLGRILRMQQRTYVPTDNVYQIYLKRSAYINDQLIYADLVKEHPHVRTDTCNQDKNDLSAKEQVVSIFKNQSENDLDKTSLFKCHDQGEDNLTEELRMLRNYLLFCTAKDLSVLIAFRPLNPKFVSTVSPENVIKVSQESFFAVTIGVVDLDPKKVQSIEKHHQREKNILDSAISIHKKLFMSENWDTKTSQCGLQAKSSTRLLDSRKSSNMYK